MAGRLRRSCGALAAAGAAMLFVVGNAGGRSATPFWGTWLGEVRGTNAFVAVVVGKQQWGAYRDFVVYVCDSKQIASGFGGQSPGPRFSFVSRLGAVSLRIGAREASGRFAVNGTSHPFTARLAAKPAGLYHADKTVGRMRYSGGWIVFPDHRQRGAVRNDFMIIGTPTLDLTTPLPSVSVGRIKLFPGLLDPLYL
jgi:hypothetical protein